MANAIPVHKEADKPEVKDTTILDVVGTKVDKEADVKSAPKSNKPAPKGAPKAPKADVKADIKMPDGSIRRDA